jgi:hypothetical protein
VAIADPSLADPPLIDLSLMFACWEESDELMPSGIRPEGPAGVVSG